MKIATCTPVEFNVDSQFFGRDSGLLCRGFQATGVDCVLVMPGAAKTDDPIDLLRCTQSQLIDPQWWQSLRLDLVVLYAWGDPRYLQLAGAIRRAGIFLIQSLDTAGLHTPYGNTKEWWQGVVGRLNGPQSLFRKFRYLTFACRDLLPAIYENKRLCMINCSNAVALVSEPAARSISCYAEALGFSQIAEKTIVIPHPVSPEMVLGAGDKQRKIIVVGRWLKGDRHQKDPCLTLTVLGQFLKAFPNWTAEVVGRGSSALDLMTSYWDQNSRNRLTLTEAIPRADLIERYQQSRILLCCSRHESFHISSAEALCCGCSVVVANHPLLLSTGWFTTRESGTLATDRSASSIMAALRAEVAAWENGHRDMGHISCVWQSTFHAQNVAAKALSILGTQQ